jgi:DNA-binding Lrp family transcriptional regulator
MDEDALIQLWHEAVDSMEHRFDLTCPHRTPDLSPDIDSSKKNTVWHIEVSKGEILYPEGLSLSNPLLEGVLARETCRISLPSSLHSEKARMDIACEYGRQIVDDAVADQWFSLWKEASPIVKLHDGTKYRPHTFFEILWHLGKETAFNRMISRICQMDKHRIVIDFRDWVEWFLRYVLEYERPLSESEAGIVDTLLTNPEADAEALAERADVSPRWARSICKKMKERGQLMEFDVVVYSKIGIRAFQVIFLSDIDEQEDCSYLIEDCPFIFSNSSILTGGRGLYATLCMPDNPENLTHLDNLLNIANSHGLRVFIFERQKSGNWLNLNDYQPNTGGAWSIDWESIRMEGQMLQREDLSFVYPEIQLSDPEKSIELDETDIRLLSEFEKGKKTARSLQNTLGIRMDTILERLERLRADDIIRKSWEVHHIGLIEEAIVFTEDEKARNCTTALALRLPRCFVDYDQDNRLFMRSRLPPGGAFGLSHSLEPINSLSGIHLVGDRIWGRWHLSDWIEEWNPKTGQWSPTSRDLSRWYRSMEEGPDVAF